MTASSAPPAGPRKRSIHRSPGRLATTVFAATALVVSLAGGAHAATTTSAPAPGAVTLWGGGYASGPIPADLGTDIIAVDGGDSHNVALHADGTVTVWGDPVQFTYYQGRLKVTNVIDVAAIDGYTMTLQEDGSVGFFGATPSGRVEGIARPPLGIKYTAIAAGGLHALALRSDGKVKAWGLGPGAEVPADLGTDVTAIAAGDRHSTALHEDGTISAWGSTLPTSALADVDGVTAIASGHHRTLALHQDGTVTGWSLSEGDTVPAGLTDVTAIATGAFQSLALHADGTITIWSYDGWWNGYMPEALDGKKVTAIAAGRYHSLAIYSDREPTAATWTIDGFLGPVTTDSLNTVKAGATVPLQFRVHDGATELTDPAAIDSFTATKVSCEAAAGVTTEEVEFTTTGNTTLRYTEDGHFQQNWKTPKTKGCYQVTVTTTDGTALSTTFQLR